MPTKRDKEIRDKAITSQLDTIDDMVIVDSGGGDGGIHIEEEYTEMTITVPIKKDKSIKYWCYWNRRNGTVKFQNYTPINIVIRFLDYIESRR